MGKAAKTRRSEQRKRQKRAEKERKRALYASYAQAGQNKKSKRNSLNAKRRFGISTTKHVVTNCGNVGCSRCFPDLAMPRMNASHSRIAPKKKRPRQESPQRIFLAENNIGPQYMNPVTG